MFELEEDQQSKIYQLEAKIRQLKRDLTAKNSIQLIGTKINPSVILKNGKVYIRDTDYELTIEQLIGAVEYYRTANRVYCNCGREIEETKITIDMMDNEDGFYFTIINAECDCGLKYESRNSFDNPDIYTIKEYLRKVINEHLEEEMR